MVRRLVLALVAATACTFPEKPLPPGERQFVVHAVLDASQRYQLVNLAMTEGVQFNPQELDDAAVSITTPDGTTLFARQDTVRDATGKFLGTWPDYRIDLQGAGVSLQPGGTYQLRVVTRSGEIVTGQTTIPTSTPVAAEGPTDFHRLSDTLRLSWPRVPGARTYQVQAWVTRGPSTPNPYTYRSYDAFADTSITLAGTMKRWNDEDVFPPRSGAGFRVRVYVYAVDDNYYEYYRLLGDPFVGAAPGHLKGGLGVFGAIVPVIQRELIMR